MHMLYHGGRPQNRWRETITVSLDQGETTVVVVVVVAVSMPRVGREEGGAVRLHED